MIHFLFVFFCLIFLVILHEFSHFIVAKKSGVEIEEFGIGYPPRLIGKKIGQTIYSINLLPFGAFVKMKGEIGGSEKERSFSSLPVSKKILIALAGVISFWLISAIIFTILFYFGNRVAISDEENGNLVSPKIQIAFVSPNSPAEKAGLKVGDSILKVKSSNSEIAPNKVKEVQQFIKSNAGKEITLTIERGGKTFDVSLVPRVLPPEGEGPMGVLLVKTAIKKYPLYQAPLEGIKTTVELTWEIIKGYFQALKNLFSGLPSGIQVTGPVGIFQMMLQASQLGFNYFFNFLALISIYLAILNALPIPALDGGKVLFLAIEGIRKKPISPEIEGKITAVFFILLIALVILVTIKDISRIF